MAVSLVRDMDGATDGVVLALIADLFFSVTVRNAIRRLGHVARVVREVDELIDAAASQPALLAIVDLGAVRADEDWESIGALDRDGVPVLVFGPHRDVDGLRQAKAAGVTRVVSNGQFHREMGDLIARYALAPSCPVAVGASDLDDAATLHSVPPGMRGEGDASPRA